MPNAQSGVAEYGYELLKELHSLMRTTVIVPRANEVSQPLPDTVHHITPQALAMGIREPMNSHLYHMGNHNLYHSWMLSPMRKTPGITVMHDLSLFDLFRGLYYGSDELWKRELKLNGYDPELSHTISVDGKDIPNRLHYNFLSNVIPYSKLTVCHSQFGCTTISELFPHSRTHCIPLAAKLHCDPQEDDDRVWNDYLAPPTFAVIGGISRPKRTHVVIKAFAQALNGSPYARLIIAGRCDDLDCYQEIVDLIEKEHLGDSISIKPDVTNEELQNIISSSRMVITLRWPTAGETSAVIMQSLGSGRVAITSDLPQFREFDETFVKRIPINDIREVKKLQELMQWSIKKPLEVKIAGQKGLSWVESHATFARVAEQYAEVIQSEHSNSKPKFSTKTQVVGINAFGDWEATTGLAHAARRLVTSLIDQDVNVSPNYIDSLSPHDLSLIPPEFGHLVPSNIHPVELHTLNINEFHLVNSGARENGCTTPYRIATWAWEFPYIPESLQQHIMKVDEIWVISSFIKRAFQRYTDKPITVIPCVVPKYPRPDMSSLDLRRKLGLPEEKTLFLFSFDFNSTLERKNPMAVVEAYAAAAADVNFRNSNCLIIKSVHARDPFKSQLESALKSIGGIHLDWHLDASQMSMLFHSIDVYISLHRSEGFGLGMAEAMAIGKPVIATAYSGNLDFMNSSNSCLVGYNSTTVRHSDFSGNEVAKLLFEPGNIWAEPNINEATQLIQLLASSSMLRQSTGKAAERTIACNFSSSVVGRLATNRLNQIYNQFELPAATLDDHILSVHSQTTLIANALQGGDSIIDDSNPSLEL